MAVRAEPGRRDRTLIAAATLFSVAVLVHNFDHLRRGGDSVTADVFWIGTLAIFIEVGVVILAFVRHPLAPPIAVASGVSLAAGYVFVHFTPHRAWLSDSFVSGHASALSIAAASFESVAALNLAVAGVRMVRRDRAASVSRGTIDKISPWEALRHPVVVAMILGNGIVLIGSLATR
jgi:hypothetical protein